MPDVFDVYRVYLFIFGALTIGGGVMGFVKAKSRPSLIAGGSSGLLLLVAGYLMGSVVYDRIAEGAILGAVISAALAGRFVPRFVKTKKLMPAGLMGIMSLVGVIMPGLAFLQHR